VRGGVKANDRPWRDLRKHLKKLGQEGAHVKVGILASTNAPVSGEADLVTIGAAHELGTESLPTRSFIKAGLEDSQDAHVKMVAQLSRAVLSGQATVDEALGRLGLWAATAIRRFITDGKVTPELKPSTVERKGSSKVLVDTGQLVGSISWEVVDK